MKNLHKKATIITKRLSLGLIAVVLSIATLSIAKPASAAACVQSTDYGKVTGSVLLPGAATYRVWTRMMVPDAANNTYMLQLGGNCYTVSSGAAANTWVWVASQSGTTSSKVDVSLGSGSTSYTLLGNKPGVKIDRLVFTSDLTCTPTGDGANCDTPADSQPPTVQLTAPAEGGTVSGNVQVAASASDNTGVTKVEFFVNSTLVKTSTAAPHNYQWDTTASPNGTYLVAAKAYDAAGNVSSDSYSVLVQNGDQQVPSVPGNLKATAPTYNRVNLTWSASTDNTAVTGYVVLRNTVPIATLSNVTSYTDNSVTANIAYSYQVAAFDKAGNQSAASPSVKVTTPSVPDTQAPTMPNNLSAAATSSTQINLSWSASTDNIGVARYDVYRSTGSGSAQKIATSTAPSFGDTGLNPSTNYSYYVIAKDGAGNQSQQSTAASATTQASNKKRGVITGTVTSRSTGRSLGAATVVIQDSGKQKHLYQVDRNGRYRIGRLDPGTYRLTFGARGYTSASYTVKVGEGSVTTKNVTLQKR